MFPETRWLPPDSLVSTDSCLTGCGGWSKGEFFHCTFPAFILNKEGITINELECLAVVIAIKLWHVKLHDKNMLMHCDNESTVTVINKGSARNAFMQSCLRELVWYTANNNTWVKMCYVPGISNRLSDLLSRWHLDKKFPKLFLLETEGLQMQEVKVDDGLFTFDHEW